MDSQFYCSSEWHFARLTGKGATLAAVIYSHSLRLSKKSKVYSASIPQLAKYFDKDERTVRKAVRLLLALGFFEELHAEPGAAVCYQPIYHQDWAQKHPHKCCEKSAMPWAGEQQDTLGPELYAISGQRFKVYPNFLKGMRKTGHSDAAIREHLRTFIGIALPNDKKWAVGFAGHFIKYLKSQPLLPSTPSHKMQGVPLAQNAGRELAQSAGWELAQNGSLV